MIQRILPFAAGAAWGGVVFLMGLRVFFPSDATVERLRYELDRASDGGWQLVASGAAPWRGTGLLLRDVELLKVDKQPRPRRADDEEAAEEPVQASRFLVARHLAARLRVLPLLTGDLSAGFDAGIYEGDLSGFLSLDGESIATEAELDGLNLGLLPLDGEKLTLDLTGQLRGSWDLVLGKEDLAKSTGTVALEISGLVLNSVSFSGLDWNEQGTFEKAVLELDLADGKAKVEKCEVVGDLFDGQMDGDITLNRALDRSRLRLKLQFSLGETLDAMVKLVPGPRDARRDDGTYHYQVTGTLLHPSLRAERERGSITSRRRPSPSLAELPGTEGLGPAMLPGTGPSAGDEADPEERRRLREERIRERRERLRQRREEAQAARGEGERGGPEDDREPPLGRDEIEEDVDLLRDVGEEPGDLPLPPDGPFDDVELGNLPLDEELGEDYGE